MSSRRTNSITLSNLSRRQMSAIEKNAERLGLTSEEYLKDLVDHAIEREKIESRKTFRELSIPFQKAFAGLSEEQLDELAQSPRRKARR